jgi:hypothetical protein
LQAELPVFFSATSQMIVPAAPLLDLETGVRSAATQRLLALPARPEPPVVLVPVPVVVVAVAVEVVVVVVAVEVGVEAVELVPVAVTVVVVGGVAVEVPIVTVWVLVTVTGRLAVVSAVFELPQAAAPKPVASATVTAAARREARIPLMFALRMA